MTTMSDPRTNLQAFQSAQRTKRKRSVQTSPSEATTSFLSPNQFAVLSNSESEIKEDGAPSQSKVHQTRIPPIVIYSYLTNHSPTLKQVNEKLSTPVDVKSKANRLLLYTKSTQDYNILLTEIRTAKLAYHTYPLPETTQPRLVLKGIPPNVPEEDIREELATHDIQTVRITQITKMDKTTKTVISRYPIFVVTFQPGTDMRKELQLHKLCHCTVRWEKYKNSRPIRQCFNCQSFRHSSTFCGRPPKCVKCDQQHASKDCPKPASSPPKCVNCGGEHPANFTGCPQYLQLNYTQWNNDSQQRRSTKTSNPPFQYQQSQFPVLKTHQQSSTHQQTWAQATSRSATNSTQQPISSVIESIRAIMAMFNFQQLSTQMRQLASKLQETDDPITKLITVTDTVVNCFATFK